MGYADNGAYYNDYYGAVLGAFAYMGFVTTPPCSTGVQWYVLDKTMSMQSRQLEILYALIGGGNVQRSHPSNMRWLIIETVKAWVLSSRRRTLGIMKFLISV